MKKFLLRVIIPLITLYFAMLGHALYTSMIGLRLEGINAGELYIGLLGTSFFAGYILSCLNVEHLICHYAHVRTYCMVISILAITSLLIPLTSPNIVWVVLRFIAGVATGAIMVLIESWVLGKSQKGFRGQALGIYLMVVYLGQTTGQISLNIGSPTDMVPFMIITLLFLLSQIPVSLAKNLPVEFKLTEKTISFKEYFSISPASVAGTFIAGMILGAVYVLLPIYFKRIDFSMKDTSVAMACIIFGGLLFQYPIGKLSDMFDRRRILMGNSLVLFVLSILIILLPKEYVSGFKIIMFIFGGCAFTLYPLAAGHACDLIPRKQLSRISKRFLSTYGIGCICAPMIATLTVMVFDTTGLFIYFASLSLGLTAFLIFRTIVFPDTPQKTKKDMSPLGGEVILAKRHKKI